MKKLFFTSIKNWVYFIIIVGFVFIIFGRGQDKNAAFLVVMTILVLLTIIYSLIKKED